MTSSMGSMSFPDPNVTPEYEGWAWDGEKWVKDCPASGGSGSGDWELIEIVTGDKVNAIEVDIPSGYEKIRVTASLFSVANDDPLTSSELSTRARIRNSGVWSDGNHGHVNPYRTDHYGIEGGKAANNYANENTIRPIGDYTGSGAFNWVFDFVNYQNDKPWQDTLIRVQEMFLKSGVLPVVASSSIWGTSKRLGGGNNINIDGIRFFIVEGNGSFYESKVIVEGLK